jgi:hypothetical protein
LICDIQKAPAQIYQSSQAIASSGTVSFNLINMSQPVFAGFFLFRWVNDLTATYTSAQQNAAYGRNWFNINGWLQPSGTALPLQPMFTNIGMKSGNNNLLYQASIWDFLDDKSIRYFKNGASTARGIPSFSYDHMPTRPNSCLGSVDFSVVNQPQVFFTFNPNASALAYGATIGAWATQDIGFSSNLQADQIFFTRNNVDVTNYDIIRTLSLLLFSCLRRIRQVHSISERKISKKVSQMDEYAHAAVAPCRGSECYPEYIIRTVPSLKALAYAVLINSGGTLRKTRLRKGTWDKPAIAKCNYAPRVYNTFTSAPPFKYHLTAYPVHQRPTYSFYTGLDLVAAPHRTNMRKFKCYKHR